MICGWNGFINVYGEDFKLLSTAYLSLTAWEFFLTHSHHVLHIFEIRSIHYFKKRWGDFNNKKVKYKFVSWNRFYSLFDNRLKVSVIQLQLELAFTSIHRRCENTVDEQRRGWSKWASVIENSNQDINNENFTIP